MATLPKVLNNLADEIGGGCCTSRQNSDGALHSGVQGRDELILSHLHRRHHLDQGAVLIVQRCNPGRVGGDDNPRLYPRRTKPMAPSRGPRIAFERTNHLASHSSEGADLSLQLEPLGREAAMLMGVPVALWSAAASPVHPANVMAPHRWSLAP